MYSPGTPVTFRPSGKGERNAGALSRAIPVKIDLGAGEGARNRDALR